MQPEESTRPWDDPAASDPEAQVFRRTVELIPALIRFPDHFITKFVADSLDLPSRLRSIGWTQCPEPPHDRLLNDLDRFVSVHRHGLGRAHMGRRQLKGAIEDTREDWRRTQFPGDVVPDRNYRLQGPRLCRLFRHSGVVGAWALVATCDDEHGEGEIALSLHWPRQFVQAAQSLFDDEPFFDRVERSEPDIRGRREWSSSRRWREKARDATVVEVQLAVLSEEVISEHEEIGLPLSHVLLCAHRHNILL